MDGVPLVERTVTEPLATIPEPGGESSYLGQLIDGRYRINRLIGRGGMGTVYEVDHVHMQKKLAMKLLHEDMVVRKQLISRFTREARAVSRLSNEHTVRVYDFGRHKAVFFLVMEYLDGEDLEIILSREGALPWKRALRILDMVCDSLEEAHGAGIIHRDLKPENIMILRKPVGADYVKVLDFGLAKITENADDVFSVHSHRDLFGTPFYMSPEQIRSEEIDPRADVYSLGCLLYRLLTNQHVYDAPYAFDVLRQHLTAQIPSVCRANPKGGIPARADRIVWRAMAKRRENRFADIAALRREITATMENPDGDSLVPPVRSVTEPIPSIDADLEARLQAFEQSHQVAEARMHGEEPPDLPIGEVSAPQPPLLVGIAVDDESDPDLDIPDGLLEPTGDEPSDAMENVRTIEMAMPTVIDPPRDLAEWINQPATPTPEPARETAPLEPLPTETQSEQKKSSGGRSRRLPTNVLTAVAEPKPAIVSPDIDDMPGDDALLRTNDFLLDLGDEEADYAIRLRRRRRWMNRLGAVALIALVATGGWYFLTMETQEPPTGEVEPNNNMRSATPIVAGKPMKGRIGDKISVFESDRDFYRLDLEASGKYLELELTAVKGLDLYINVMDATGHPLTRVDYDGIGQKETLHRFLVPASAVVMEVGEAKAGDAAPSEGESDSYELTATVVDAPAEGELEPNDIAAAANTYRPGARIHGYLDGPKDKDFYVVRTDQALNLKRWEFALEADASLVPRVSLYRKVGGDYDTELIFADEGTRGLLHTVYEQPDPPSAEYLVVVEHSGRGERRGAYTLVADMGRAQDMLAEERNDERATANHVSIGQRVHGILEGAGDVDVFAIRVTDPQHRQIEVVVDSPVREKVRLSISDLNKAKSEDWPQVVSGRTRVPQPIHSNQPIRFKGNGEMYYLTLKPISRKDRDLPYNFRVVRVMNEGMPARVGGPNY